MKLEDVISIIVPVYNMEKYLDRCMNSILNQTYRQLEIILVDDGSTDASPQMCDAYAMQDDRVKVVHKTNGGLSDARNAGLQVATGAYIGYVDSDDWIELDMYERMHSACVENNADIAICKYASVFEDSIEKAQTDRVCILSRDELVDKYIGDDDEIVIYNSVWSKLFRSELVDGMLFPVGHNSEDIMYTTKSFCKANRGVYIDRCLYNYVQNRGDSIMNTNRGERMFRDEIPFWKEHIEHIGKTVSAAMGDKAAYWFYRRMLSYYIDLRKDKRTCDMAKKLADLLLTEKQEIIRVYGKADISKSDKVRMKLFITGPSLYYVMDKLYMGLRTSCR